MPIGRAGAFNIQGIQSPGPYVINNLPAPVITGVPSNVEGMVGVGSWGLTNAVLRGSTPTDCNIALGPPIYRPGDIATHVNAASQLGGAVAYAWVRVTDGSDTAATYTDANGTWTARCTGVLGNGISIIYQRTGAVGAYAAIVSFPGSLPERYDNIFSGLQSITVAPGTGYKSVPNAAVSAPQKTGGVPATVQPTLVAVGTPAIAAGGGGTGHAVGDVLTLGAGVRVTVATVTGGVIQTVTLTSPGSITSGSVPLTVGQQTASTGVGTGAAFTLAFGLGAPIITNGSGYYVATGPALTVALSGGQPTTAGTYTPVTSFWAALTTAINTGTPQRGRSGVVVFSPSNSTAAPTTNVALALLGGTDGANGVGTTQLIGADTSPGTGLYALRGAGTDTVQLCDSTDSSLWGVMNAFAISEGSYAVGTTQKSDTVAGAIAARQAVGLDDPQFKLIVGDWPTMYITGLGAILVSPVAVYQGLGGNLSPEQGSINKNLTGVVGTQSSQMGLPISQAIEDIAETGGIDIIGKSTALGVSYFSFLTGRNSSSNTSANGDEYTRMTNFLSKSFLNVGRTFVGKLQSQRPDDPTRTAALQAFDSFCSSLVEPSSGSGGYGTIDEFLNVCDLTNNSPAFIQRGYLFLTSRVEYLSVVRYFVINLFGGNNVSIQVASTNPGQVSF